MCAYSCTKLLRMLLRLQEATEVACDVLHVKTAGDAGREISRAIGGMRQTNRGPMLLVVQVGLLWACEHAALPAAPKSVSLKTWSPKSTQS